MKKRLNPMCEDCAKPNKDCSGCSNLTYTGCVFRDKTVYIVDVSNMDVFDYCAQSAAANKLKHAYEHKAAEVERLIDMVAQYPGNAVLAGQLKQTCAARYEAMTWDEYNYRQRAHLLAGEPMEVTRALFDEQLNALPPLEWCTLQGVEMFCMSEMWTGTYTTQYAHDKRADKYYSKMVDVTDRTTWIHNYLRCAQV